MVLSLNRDERVESTVEGDISPVHRGLYLSLQSMNITTIIINNMQIVKPTGKSQGKDH